MRREENRDGVPRKASDAYMLLLTPFRELPTPAYGLPIRVPVRSKAGGRLRGMYIAVGEGRVRHSRQDSVVSWVGSCVLSLIGEAFVVMAFDDVAGPKRGRHNEPTRRARCSVETIAVSVSYAHGLLLSIFVASANGTQGHRTDLYHKVLLRVRDGAN